MHIIKAAFTYQCQNEGAFLVSQTANKICLQGPWGRGGKRRAASGESAPKPLAAWTALAGEGTKRRRNQIRAFVEDLKTGTALNAGPARYRAAGSLSSVDGESTDTPVRGKPSEAGTQLSAIHTQRYLSAAPRPHRSRTELN